MSSLLLFAEGVLLPPNAPFVFPKGAFPLMLAKGFWMLELLKGFDSAGPAEKVKELLGVDVPAAGEFSGAPKVKPPTGAKVCCCCCCWVFAKGLGSIELALSPRPVMRLRGVAILSRS